MLKIFEYVVSAAKVAFKIAVTGFLFLMIAGSGMPLILGIIGAGAVAAAGVKWVFSGGSSANDGRSFLDTIKENVNKRLEKRNALKEARRERSQENRFSFNPFKGNERGVGIGRYLDAKHIPVDMVADFSRNRVDPTFTCAGITGLVSMKHKGLLSQNVEYRFVLDDERKAVELSKRAKRSDGAVHVFRDKRGRIIVSADNANDINEMAKLAFPLKGVDATRNLDLVSEYIISGCSSYEEALQTLKARKESDPSFRAAATYTRLSVEIDGREHVLSDDRDNRKVDLSSGLEAGTFVIRETERSTVSAKVDVPADILGDRIPYYVYDKMPSEATVEIETTYSNVDAEKSKYIVNSSGRNIELCEFGDGLYESDRLFIPFNNHGDLLSFLSGGVLKEGANAMLGTPSDGDLYVSLEPDMKLLTEVSGKRPVDEALVAKYESAGLSGADIRWSLLLDDISRVGSAEVVAYKDISLDGAQVSGVNAELLKERIADKSLPELDGPSLKDWLSDQGRIGYVSLKLDDASSELNIDAVIDGKACAYESIRLTPEQMKDLQARGGISEMQKREFLLQYDTDEFKSYDFKGREALANPVADFVKGQAPRRLKDFEGYVSEVKKHVNKNFKK